MTHNIYYYITHKKEEEDIIFLSHELHPISNLIIILSPKLLNFLN